MFQHKVVEAYVGSLPFSTKVIWFCFSGLAPTWNPILVSSILRISANYLQRNTPETLFLNEWQGKYGTHEKKLNSVLFTRDALRIEMSGSKSLKSYKYCSFTRKLKKEHKC